MKTRIYLLLTVLVPVSMLAQKTTSLSKNKATAALPNLYWSLRGNSNLNDTVNFLGTTDRHRLSFRVNNFQSGLIELDSFQRNTTFGYQTLNSLSPFGFDNTAFGYQALYKNTDGRSNVAMGVRAMYGNTTGQNNLAIGNFTLLSNEGGSYNTAVGGSMTSNLDGSNNVALGFGALTRNESGSDNIAIGLNALYFSSASENTAIGYYGLYNNQTGQFNTTTGYLSLFNNTVGNNNTAFGSNTLYNNSTGNNNTAFGYQALLTNQTGVRNTALGASADVTDANFRNSTAIGFGAKADASYKVQVGNMFVKSIGGVVGWTNYSDARIKQDVKENVPGLSFIRQLKAVTYHLNTAKANELLGKKDSLNQAGESNIEKILFTGFLAQDVEKAAKNINYDFSGVDKGGKIMGLRYSEFVVPLVKAVQELSNKNDSLQSVNQKQQSQIESLQTRLDNIEARLNGLQGGNFSAAQVQGIVSKPDHQLLLSPNPASNYLLVTFTVAGQSSAAISITDIQGKVVAQKMITAYSGTNNSNIDISGLSKGTYTLQVKTNEMTLTKKFTKE